MHASRVSSSLLFVLLFSFIKDIFVRSVVWLFLSVKKNERKGNYWWACYRVFVWIAPSRVVENGKRLPMMFLVKYLTRQD